MAIDVTNLVDMVKSGRTNRGIYYDRELYEQELERVFMRSWLYLCHESQIPEPGDFVTAYMAGAPVVVSRDKERKINAFLNICRHRGNRVCRVDEGNAASFTCSYHGWTYGVDGRLVSVPALKECYFEELDLEKLGLLSVAHIDSYKGLIFATWDQEAPSLQEYLGDAAFYLDVILDRREGGTEVIGGVHKWVMPCNWKFAAENFCSEGYHVAFTHLSAAKALGDPNAGQIGAGNGIKCYAGNGHALGISFSAEGGPRFRVPVLKQYIEDVRPERERRLGPIRSNISSIGAGTIFPNLSFLEQRCTIRVWQPVAPDRTEVWSWCIVDKAAPAEVKQAMLTEYQQVFGTGGMFEQDDVENWQQGTESCAILVARQLPLLYNMGLGHETYHEDLPGRIARGLSETTSRGFYQRWSQMMNAETSEECRAHPWEGSWEGTD